jgi:translation initiation factor 2B subunit (eIF-2B alpha/beta/delta family)
VDRKLRTELDAIARDDHSGAAELALRATSALQAWLRRHRKLTEAELLEMARALLRAQPSMAPLLRLANEVACAVDAGEPARTLRKATAEFGELLRNAPQRIARHFERALQPSTVIVATYSYSSTLLHALKYARRRIGFVLCSESRPGNEGRATAREIAAAGIKVILATDVALASRMDQASVFATGADAILPYGFVNKVGTGVLVLCALKAHTPVWILADTTKFVPKLVASQLWMTRMGKRSEVWRQAPAGVTNLNPLFEPANLSSAVRVLTERGWMTPNEVRRELRKIRVSPRLRALAD